MRLLVYGCLSAAVFATGHWVASLPAPPQLCQPWSISATERASVFMEDREQYWAMKHAQVEYSRSRAWALETGQPCPVKPGSDSSKAQYRAFAGDERERRGLHRSEGAEVWAKQHWRQYLDGEARPVSDVLNSAAGYGDPECSRDRRCSSFAVRDGGWSDDR